MAGFRNWSGSVGCEPRRHARPRSERQVRALVRRARRRGWTVRPVGAGHSSTPLVVTDDVLVSLERLSGVVDHDRSGMRARVLPGTGLADLGEQLARAGLAMENYGDVDYQAIAGAVGTGTHGTGIRYGTLSSNLVGARLVTGTGDVLAFGEDAGESPDSEMVRAARVSLGALGIFTSMTLRVEPAIDLHRRNWCTHVDWAVDHFDELNERTRHADFYWYPRSDLAQVRMLDEPGREAGITPPGQLRRDETGPDHEIIPNVRELRYEEMEYLVPRDAWQACFRQVRERIKARHRQHVGWRVLVRTIAGDDAMLSPSQGPSVSIALLQNVGLPYQEYFDDMEPLLRSYGGRPHWGKKHTMTAEQLRRCYPDWDRFLEIRARLDPDGVLLNDHLAELFGVER